MMFKYFYAALTTSNFAKIINKLMIASISSSTLLSVATPAAAQLAFSPDCRNFQGIQVPANRVILFSKHPVPHPDGSATVFAINGDENYVVPDGVNACIVANPSATDSYCFVARDDNTILQIGFALIPNPGGLPACR